VLDHLVHGVSSLENPTRLEFSYLRTYAGLTAPVAAAAGGRPTTLSIGGGAYTFPRYLEATYPEAVVEVVEIDPGVTEIAHRELGLPRATRIHSHHGDARQFFLERRPRARYDLIYGDAFNDLSIPYHLTTREFNDLVAAALAPGGLYLANVIDDPEQGRFLAAYANTLRLSYPHVQVLSDPAARERLAPAAPAAPGRRPPRTWVVAASRRPLAELAGGPAGEPTLATRLDDAELAALLARSAPRLTDDYAPVENLLAPVFVRRGY
jgi:hypothetical protein